MEAVNYHLRSMEESESCILSHYGESHRPISRYIDVTEQGDEHVHHSSVQKRRCPIRRPRKIDVASGRDELCYDSNVTIFCSSEDRRKMDVVRSGLQ